MEREEGADREKNTLTNLSRWVTEQLPRREKGKVKEINSVKNCRQ